MFDIVSFTQSGRPTVTSDPYVPLTVQWPRYASTTRPPSTFVISDDGGLAEIKIDSGNGELLEFVLLEVGKIKAEENTSEIIVTDAGVPLLSASSDPYEGVSLGVRLAPGVVMFELSQEVPYRFFGSDEVSVGCSASGRWVCLMVSLEDAVQSAFI